MLATISQSRGHFLETCLWLQGGEADDAMLIITETHIASTYVRIKGIQKKAKHKKKTKAK
jgi:hypothetical protein